MHDVGADPSALGALAVRQGLPPQGHRWASAGGRRSTIGMSQTLLARCKGFNRFRVRKCVRSRLPGRSPVRSPGWGSCMRRKQQWTRRMSGQRAKLLTQASERVPRRLPGRDYSPRLTRGRELSWWTSIARVNAPFGARSGAPISAHPQGRPRSGDQRASRQAPRTDAARSTSFGQTASSGQDGHNGMPGPHHSRPIRHAGKSIAPGRSGFAARLTSSM